MDVYVARQAIFNNKKKVIAYELLFRDSTVNAFSNSDSSGATLKLIKNSFSVIGLDQLTSGKKAFINFDYNLIKSGIIETLPKELIIVEILETVVPNKEIIEACKILKGKGYTLALDDFEYSDDYKDLFKYIDIIKVDFIITKDIERKNIIKRVNNKNIKFLAEKVETEEEYLEAISYGYSFFQGYFFCKPTIISGQEILAYNFTYLKLINELNSDEVNLNYVEHLIKSDISLSYKLLKLVNSAHYGFKTGITSIRQTIVLIGAKDLKRWLFIITLQSIDEKETDEIIKMSLIRAVFGELLIKKTKHKNEYFEMFLTGLFSMIDVLLSRPMKEVIKELPISKEAKEALMGKENVLSEILKLVIHYERGSWNEVNLLIDKNQLDKDQVSSSYLEALKWSKELNSM